MGRVAILGGTGPEGLGLGMRLAMIGEDVLLGSRSRERAEKAAEESSRELRRVGYRPRISGCPNQEAASEADLVVLAFPFAGVTELLPKLANALAGKLVLDLVNPIERREGLFRLTPVPSGSAAETIQEILPESRVVSAFKNESAEELKQIERAVHGDVLVCSDDKPAREQVLELAGRIPSLRPVDAGRLANARSVEAITPLLLNLNRRHHTTTSVQILGLHDGH